MRFFFFIKFSFILMIACSSSFSIQKNNVLQDKDKLQDTCVTIHREGDFNLHECYYPLGQLKSRTCLRGKERWGSIEEYYENGQLSMIGQAYYDVRQGSFYYFDSEGAIYRVAHYMVFKDLNPMNERTRVIDKYVDSLTGELVEMGHSYPSKEKLDFVEFYSRNGLLDSVQYWNCDTIRHTSRHKK